MSAPGESPGGEGVPDLDRRLEEIVYVIQDLAALRFDARAAVGTTGDFVDAVAAGVNSLGEELEASYEELERRVAERTAELAIATRELRQQALQDHLTGLANRVALWDQLAQRLEAVGRRSSRMAVLFLDLDDFKMVNDTFGHAAGDRLLAEAALRIQGELRAGDTAARVGGDEFVVLLDDVVSDAAALSVARRVAASLRAPYEFEGHQYTTTSSIGVALAGDGPTNPDAIIAAADAAMYDAKRSGRGLCVLHGEVRHGEGSLIDTRRV
ncbi:diguanylate cyclase [Demequina sp. TTPB684]|uniref:GGDEF domain-containing protein n=1 Tax=unclassified Demequina TaxID=2620311 RepID=UPI001CF4288E|nr:MULTISPECIES: GGDEF domain-containing protein [unclassified Demequina]MCB2411982.1 diguanylate cyclase [Demequina sp. TTPB684]UPU87427.1 diguanylate cyclase [Demequina sp. TMPB413]